MNGELLGCKYADLSAEDMRSVRKLTLPNEHEFYPSLLIYGTCSGCGSQQRGWVGMDNKTVVFCCSEEGALVMGVSDKPVKVVTYA